MEDLGGARTHNTKSGIAHYLGSDEEDAIDYVKALLSYLPSNNLDPTRRRRRPATSSDETDVDPSSTRSSRTRPNQPVRHARA